MMISPKCMIPINCQASIQSSKKNASDPIPPFHQWSVWVVHGYWSSRRCFNSFWKPLTTPHTMPYLLTQKERNHGLWNTTRSIPWPSCFASAQVISNPGGAVTCGSMGLRKMPFEVTLGNAVKKKDPWSLMKSCLFDSVWGSDTISSSGVVPTSLPPWPPSQFQFRLKRQLKITGQQDHEHAINWTHIVLQNYYVIVDS